MKPPALKPKQRAALGLMQGMIRKGKADPTVRRIAVDILKHYGVTEGDFGAEIKAVAAFLKSKVRYVKDPHRVETIADPLDTLKNGFGDCDDLSVLLCSLLESIGHRCRLKLVGQTRFSHIYPEAHDGKEWTPVDLARPWEKVHIKKIYPISAILKSVRCHRRFPCL